MSEKMHVSVDLTIEQWTAMLRVLEDHAESLVDWDDDTRSFYEEIVNKHREAMRA